MDNKIKIVITHPSQLSERWVNYYCLDHLSEVFDIEYWDCSAIVYPSFMVAHPLSPNYLHEIKTLREFENKLNCLPHDTVLITEVHNNSKTIEFHKIQGKCFPRYAHVGFYGNTIDGIWKNENITQQERRLRSIKNVLYQSKLIRDFAKWLFHHRDVDYQENRIKAKSSDFYKECYSMSCVGSSIHRVNHPDFEQYLKVKGMPRLIKKPYIVFIDGFYPYHPEAFVYSEIENIDEVAFEYYQSMNAFFNYIEKEMHCEVIIAAHPYANYLEHNPFEGRDIYYGKTAQLIKDSNAVCMHNSNAFSYVALFDKPVAIVTNTAMDKSRDGDITRLYKEKMKIPVFSTDDILAYPNPLFNVINPDLRIKYIKDYLGEMDNPHPNSELIQKYVEEFHEYIVKCIDDEN